MLRPASLLSTKWTFDAPLWPVASLPSAGACYRALRRLPGQDLHLLEERVFQDAPCPKCTSQCTVAAQKQAVCVVVRVLETTVVVCGKCSLTVALHAGRGPTRGRRAPDGSSDFRSRGVA